jgi:hypothetical protein
MDDECENKNLEKNVSGQSFPALFNVGVILQSFWIRCRSVFSNVVDREFMEIQLYFVLCCGSILWFLLIFEEII